MTPETRPLQGIVDFDGTIGGLSKEKYLEKFGWGFCVLTQLPIFSGIREN